MPYKIKFQLAKCNNIAIKVYNSREIQLELSWILTIFLY